MSDLYPSFDMPDIVGATENTVVVFPKSWLWDWDICDFVQTGSGDVVEVDGLTAWVQWCVKAILTQRLAFVVYDWNYGADIESCLKQPTRAVTEAELEREITETLLTDPRTAEVKNFRFEWSGDELTVWFTVVNALGQPAEVQVGVGYREVQRQFSLSRVEQYVSDWMSGTLVGVEVNDRGRLTLIQPPTPTFTRNSIAYKSDGSQVAVNVPRFEAGKFGQGILIEEGTTNLLPSNDAQGKTLFFSNNSSHSSNTLETSFGLNDLYSLKSVQLVFTTNKGFYSSFYPTVAGNVYTFSYYVYNATSTSHNFTARLLFYDGSGNEVLFFESNSVPVPAQQWKRISVTATAPSGSTQCRVAGWESGTTSQVGDVYYFDSFQLEQKPYATSWVSGTRDDDYCVVNNSGIAQASVGAVSFWFNPKMVRGINSQMLIDIGGTGAGGIYITLAANGNINFGVWKAEGSSAAIISSTFQVSVNTWYHVVARWNSSMGCALFINGVKQGEYVGTLAPVPGQRIGIGMYNYTYAYRVANSIFDDVTFYNRALSDAEVQAIYSSGQPAPLNEYCTYKMGFDNNLNAGRGGYRLSKPIHLKSLGTCNGSNISWEANIPAGCDVKVYASVDGSTFQECENNAPIPSLSEGVSLVDKVLVIKEVLLTEDGVNIPELMAVRYNVDGTVTLRG